MLERTLKFFMSFELITIPCLSDNYAFILYNTKNRSAFLVDAPEADPINEVLSKNNLNLEKIFLTHHHADHTDGLNKILEKMILSNPEQWIWTHNRWKIYFNYFSLI